MNPFYMRFCFSDVLSLLVFHAFFAVYLNSFLVFLMNQFYMRFCFSDVPLLSGGQIHLTIGAHFRGQVHLMINPRFDWRLP